MTEEKKALPDGNPGAALRERAEAHIKQYHGHGETKLGAQKQFIGLIGGAGSEYLSTAVDMEHIHGWGVQDKTGANLPINTRSEAEFPLFDSLDEVAVDLMRKTTLVIVASAPSLHEGFIRALLTNDDFMGMILVLAPYGSKILDARVHVSLPWFYHDDLINRTMRMHQEVRANGGNQHAVPITYLQRDNFKRADLNVLLNDEFSVVEEEWRWLYDLTTGPLSVALASTATDDILNGHMLCGIRVMLETVFVDTKACRIVFNMTITHKSAVLSKSFPMRIAAGYSNGEEDPEERVIFNGWSAFLTSETLMKDQAPHGYMRLGSPSKGLVYDEWPRGYIKQIDSMARGNHKTTSRIGIAIDTIIKQLQKSADAGTPVNFSL